MALEESGRHRRIKHLAKHTVCKSQSEGSACFMGPDYLRLIQEKVTDLRKPEIFKNSNKKIHPNLLICDKLSSINACFLFSFFQSCPFLK